MTDIDEIDFMDPAVQEDWFPYYRMLREQAPVWRVPATGEYFLSRYDDVTYVLRHPELFPHTSTSSEFRLLKTEAANRYYEEHGWRRKQTLGIDPPVHREYRVLVDPWFNGAGAERARPVIERLATSLMDDWIDDGEVEIVRQFAMPLPVMVITTVLGFPLDDIEQLKRWSEAWVMPFSRGLTPEQEMYVAEQGVAFQRYIWAHLQEKRRNPPTTCCPTSPTSGSTTPSRASDPSPTPRSSTSSTTSTSAATRRRRSPSPPGCGC